MMKFGVLLKNGEWFDGFANVHLDDDVITDVVKYHAWRECDYQFTTLRRAKLVAELIGGGAIAVRIDTRTRQRFAGNK